jgi:hypothetical protein
MSIRTATEIRDLFLDRATPIWRATNAAEIRVVDEHGISWISGLRDSLVEYVDAINGWTAIVEREQPIGDNREEPFAIIAEIANSASYDGLVSPYDVIEAWPGCSGFDFDEEIDEQGFCDDAQYGSTTIRRMRAALYLVAYEYLGRLLDVCYEIDDEQ